MKSFGLKAVMPAIQPFREAPISFWQSLRRRDTQGYDESDCPNELIISNGAFEAFAFKQKVARLPKDFKLNIRSSNV